MTSLTLPDTFLPFDGFRFMEAIRGAQPTGYNTEADVVTQTADGRDLNDMWAEFTQVVALHNAERQTLIDFLTFNVTQPTEDVPEFGSAEFEEASEFGEPVGIRTSLEYSSFGYDFKWYDLAKRFTWKFLAEATAAQVESIHQAALDADNRLVFRKVMNTLFNPANRVFKGVNVYALYNGDGTVPPSYKGNTFTGSETHYLVSGGAAVDPGDLEDLIDKLERKGYSAVNGTQLVILANKQETKVIRTFRANQTTNGVAATYDFIPAQGQPTSLLTPGTQLLGPQAPSRIGGLVVVGSYGPALIVEEEFIPAGYLTIIGTGGAASLNNPVGFREHDNAALRGLRQIAGGSRTYPLVDSYYSRGFGTGVRQRGGAAIMQIKETGAYEIPTLYRTV